jgi:hypothetical protein
MPELPVFVRQKALNRVFPIRAILTRNPIKYKTIHV